ncbi:hypothetical protein L1049_006670 [Liquidambar formosana]|uniref:Uncharacterized protein n=1 Tax=Liquidambar formosana TaxID=63359 RepID=A0AAP0RFX4_LIQFO
MWKFLQGISSSRKLLVDSSDIEPIPSPLTPLLASSSGKTENQKAVSKPTKVQAVLKGIKQSPKKVNLVAALVRGMHDEDALLQLQVTVKRAAKTVYQLRHFLERRPKGISPCTLSMTKRERQLIPHKLIETSPIWGRKSANSSATSDCLGILGECLAWKTLYIQRSIQLHSA